MLEDWVEEQRKIEASKSNLNGADLSGMKLMRADLSKANLCEADLTAAYLIRANLSEADLSEADLTKAVLSEANLRGADLTETELEDTYLQGADLTFAKGLTCYQVESAYIDQETRLPDYIKISWTSETTFVCNESPPGDS